MDDALLYYEFDYLMNMQLFEHAPAISMEHDFTQRDFVSVESEFLSSFNRLIGAVKNFKTVG